MTLKRNSIDRPARGVQTRPAVRDHPLVLCASGLSPQSQIPWSGPVFGLLLRVGWRL